MCHWPLCSWKVEMYSWELQEGGCLIFQALMPYIGDFLQGLIGQIVSVVQ